MKRRQLIEICERRKHIAQNPKNLGTGQEVNNDDVI